MKSLGLPIRVGLVAIALLFVFALAGCGGNSNTTMHHSVAAPTTPSSAQEALAAAGKLNHAQLQKLQVTELRHGIAEGPPVHLLAQTLQGGRWRTASLFKTGPAPTQKFGGKSANAGAVSVLQGYDSVSLGYIPSSAAVVGCYVDGFANCATARTMFPHAHIVSIAIHLDYADFYDIEPGAGVSFDAHVFIAMMKAHRQYLTTVQPGVYAGQSWIAQAINDMNAHGYIHGRDFLLWAAAWNSFSGVYAGEDAHQWASNCCVDHDAFLASMFQAPKPPPPPKPKIVYNWTYFTHTSPAAGLIGGPYNVPFNEHGQERKDFNNERSIYHLYVTARAKSQTGKRVRYVAELKEEAHGLFQRLEGVIHRSSRKFNLEFHRYGRANVLKAIYEDQAHVSWSSVNH